MKVIVCGAGQVGYNIARYLAVAGNDVTVIDQRPELTEKDRREPGYSGDHRPCVPSGHSGAGGR